MILPSLNEHNLFRKETIDTLIANLLNTEKNTQNTSNITQHFSQNSLPHVFNNTQAFTDIDETTSDNLLQNIAYSNKEIETILQCFTFPPELNSLERYKSTSELCLKLAQQHATVSTPNDPANLYIAIGLLTSTVNDMLDYGKLKKEFKNNPSFRATDLHGNNAYDYLYNDASEALLNTIQALLQIAFNIDTALYTPPHIIESKASDIKTALSEAGNNNINESDILNAIAKQLGHTEGYTGLQQHYKTKTHLRMGVEYISQIADELNVQTQTLFKTVEKNQHHITPFFVTLTENCYFSNSFDEDTPENICTAEAHENNMHNLRIINHTVCLTLLCAFDCEITTNGELIQPIIKNLTKYNKYMFAVQKDFYNR